MFLEILKAIIYGIVEGITEWLPISSTGHLILLEQLLPLKASDAFMSMFDVVIQLGAILAVIVLFFHKLNPFSGRKSMVEKRQTWQLWFKVIVAVLPSVVLGLLLDDWMDAHLYNHVVVAIMLILYGVAFIAVERPPSRHSNHQSDLLSDSAAGGLLSGACHDSRNLSLRCHHSGGDPAGHEPHSGLGVLFLSGDSHDAGRQCAEGAEVYSRGLFHERQRVGLPDRGVGGGLCGFPAGDPKLDELCKATYLLGLWYLSDHFGRCGTGSLFHHKVMGESERENAVGA